MSQDFEALIAKIKQEAAELDLTRNLNLAPYLRSQKSAPSLVDTASLTWIFSRRELQLRLAHMTKHELINSIYEVALGRSADATGLAFYQEEMDNGVPPLLLVGLLMSSREARQMGERLPGFAAYFYLAYLYRWSKKVGAGWLVCAIARGFSAVHRLSDQLSGPGENLRLNEAGGKNSTDSVAELNEKVDARLGALMGRVTALEDSLSQLDKGLRVMVGRVNAAQGADRRPAAPCVISSEELERKIDAPADPAGFCLQDVLEQYYLAFENSHRGTEDRIWAKLEVYMPEIEKFQAVPGALPVLDLGCGRGEWLRFLGERKVVAKGVDTNSVMVRECQSQALNVSHSDLLSALKQTKDRSLAGVSAFHVAEHLPFSVLYECVLLSWGKIAHGGLLIMETPNPENVLVGSHTFYHDHTHRNPLTPSAMEFLFRHIGFQNVYIKRLNPYPEGARVPGDDPLTDRVNGHFCGPQDFAVVGQK